ncbi:UNVERIFIED_CONTAM: hypothetical protein HDU68_002371 [Siphonaria sp. JEL0065]|nr:hypothetical protein HDU68_002371 [Siphonaria sp. JEL0065]
MIFRITLIVGCILLTVATYFLVPGPSDTWLLSRQIASQNISLFNIKFAANTIMTVLTTIQAVLVSLSASVLLHHLGRVYMSRNGITPAMLDAVFQNKMQLLKQASRTPADIQLVGILVVTLFAIVFNQGGHTLFQLFLDDTGNATYPLSTTVAVINSSVFGSDLITKGWHASQVRWVLPSIAAGKSSLDALGDVAGQCNPDGICGHKVNSTATLVSCLHGEVECSSLIDTYADYHMECIHGTVANGTSGGMALGMRKTVDSIVERNNVGRLRYKDSDGKVVFAGPFIQWSIIETQNDKTVKPVYINCTIYAAWAKRFESSKYGTLNKTVVQVYKSPESVPTKPLSFEATDSCMNVPSPICALQIFTNQLPNKIFSQGSTMASDASELLSYLTTVTSGNIGFYNNKTKQEAAIYAYESEMRFTIERMYKQFMSLQLQNPNGTIKTTCTDCSVVKVYWVPDKTTFMILTCIFNGVPAIALLVSLIYSCVRRDVQSDEIRVVDILKLPVDLNALRDANAAYEVKLVNSIDEDASSKRSVISGNDEETVRLNDLPGNWYGGNQYGK